MYDVLSSLYCMAEKKGYSILFNSFLFYVYIDQNGILRTNSLNIYNWEMLLQYKYKYKSFIATTDGYITIEYKNNRKQ